jgi:hypothetical protein
MLETTQQKSQQLDKTIQEVQGVKSENPTRKYIQLTAPDGKFNLTEQEFMQKFEEYLPIIREDSLHVKVNGKFWQSEPIHGGDSVLIYATGPGGFRYVMDSPRPVFGVERMEEGLKYVRFWLQGKLCDAYLFRWTADELITLVSQRSGIRNLCLWRDQEIAVGPINWDEDSLRMMQDQDQPADYPTLWKWEIECDSRQIMLVSPERPIPDAKISIQRQWAIPRSFYLKTRSQYTDLEHEVMKNECVNEMTIRVSTEPPLQEDLKTVMIHHEGHEYLLEVSCMNHLIERLRTAFPDWWNLPDKRIGKFSLEDAQTGEEMWLIRNGIFVTGSEIYVYGEIKKLP